MWLFCDPRKKEKKYYLGEMARIYFFTKKIRYCCFCTCGSLLFWPFFDHFLCFFWKKRVPEKRFSIHRMWNSRNIVFFFRAKWQKEAKSASFLHFFRFWWSTKFQGKKPNFFIYFFLCKKVTLFVLKFTLLRRFWIKKNFF